MVDPELGLHLTIGFDFTMTLVFKIIWKNLFRDSLYNVAMPF